MKILSIGEVLELNKIIKDNNFSCKIHLSDACGGQSFWIENLEKGKDYDLDNLIKIIDEFFNNRKINIKYTKDRKNFFIVK